MNVVTTFSPRGWDHYGRQFVDTFLRHWPSWIGFHVFLEGQMPPFLDERVRWHELKDDMEHEAFCTRNKGRDDPIDWNMMPVRFGHKVFAITSPRLPVTGWRVWIDADVLTTADVDQEWVDRALPKGKALSFLGRTGIMRPGQPIYSECGFVGYNLDVPQAKAVLQDMRAAYVTDGILQMGKHNQHDSFLFDYCRKRVNVPADMEHNLAAKCRQNEFHPWPLTVLGEKMLHQKGPKRKLAAYGAVT